MKAILQAFNANLKIFATSITSSRNKMFIAQLLIFGIMFMATGQTAYAGVAFIGQAITQLGNVIVAIGAGLGIWGIVNLLEGYGNDNPGAKSQGIKQLMAGGGLIIIGLFVPGALTPLFQAPGGAPPAG